VSPEAVEFGYTGVNHLGFLHSIRCGEVDVLDAYARLNGIRFREIVQAWRAIPLKYLHLHFDGVQFLCGRSRSRMLMRMARAAMLAYAHGDTRAVNLALSRRAAPWYEDAVAPFIAATAGSRQRRPFFLTCASPNDGVREGAFRVSSEGVFPLNKVPAPRVVEELTNRFARYEMLAARAIWNRDRAAMIDALRAHPWMEDVNLNGFIDEVLGAEETDMKWEDSVA
jgi:hypothetical protein